MDAGIGSDVSPVLSRRLVRIFFYVVTSIRIPGQNFMLVSGHQTEGKRHGWATKRLSLLGMRRLELYPPVEMKLERREL